MTKGAELTEALETCLRNIAQVNGYLTDIKGVYGFAETKPDKAPLPCLLVTLESDDLDEMVGTTALRHAQYQICGVFPRNATLQDMQRCHHDILRSIGLGQLLPIRELKPGEGFEEGAVYESGKDGSTQRQVISTLSVRYVERY